jgi:glycerophosphoryl diester phosphodiesterase
MLFPRAPRVTAPLPLLIAHRGASGYRPEHTLACYELAILQGADYLEPDIVATKDGELVVRHENEIGGTTDVARHPEFADRRTTKEVDGEKQTGWFTEDFTLAELKTLRAVERLPAARPGSTVFDAVHPIATLAEVVELARRSRTADGRRVGICAEIKHPTYFARHGLPLEARVLAVLEAAGYVDEHDPVLIQCFETATLRWLAERTPMHLGQLVDDTGAPYDLRTAGDHRRSADLVTPAGLAEISRYADVVGLSKDLVIPRDATGRLLAPTAVTRHAHDAGLEVYGWTFRRENLFLPVQFRSSDDPYAAGDLRGEMELFLAAGLDCLITDNPDVADEVRRAPASPTAVPAPLAAAPARQPLAVGR